MKRHVRNGVLTAVVVAVVMGAEKIWYNGFSVSALLSILAQSAFIGLLVALAVKRMDR